MRIYVGGVNAVGKSSLLKEAAKRINYEYIHATTGLLNHLGFGKDYEKLRALKQEERDVKYREYIENLISNKDRNFFLDAHYLGLVRGRVDQVTDSWIEGFNTFVLISAPLNDVWNRILLDSKTRDRALFSNGSSELEMKNMLSNYQEQTSKEFNRLVKLYKKPYIEIFNEENRLEMGVDQLVTFIKEQEK